tara:strand:+ start:6269 stop:6655 length:387 start_codon:yes stop_codon:yes gene_type:complete
MINILLSAFLAIASGNGAASLEKPYTFTLTITEQRGDVFTTSTVVKSVPLTDGRISTDMGPDGEAPLVTGNMNVDREAGRVHADLIICRPRATACEQIAEPKLIFPLGKPAVFYVSGPKADIKMELVP